MAEEYIYLSHKYGTFLDWFQAGGGNISVKNKNILYIKQSGTAVCEAKYVKCNIDKLLDNLTSPDDNFNDCIIDDNTVGVGVGVGIPSIEVWFHTFTKKYTVHMHPCQLVNILCTESNNKNINNKDILSIPYMNPGKELSNEIYKKYNNESIIYLLNHGIIFTNDSIEELHSLIVSILKPDENIFILLGIETISKNNLIWKSKINSNTEKQYCESGELKMYIPDIAIYLGYEILNLSGPNVATKNSESLCINDYITKYNRTPVIIIYDNVYYIIAATKKKYYDIEEMLESYITFNKYGTKTIDSNNIDKLMNWDREKYRQAL